MHQDALDAFFRCHSAALDRFSSLWNKAVSGVIRLCAQPDFCASNISRDPLIRDWISVLKFLCSSQGTTSN